ncbi:MAG: EVE domain-containing protein [Acidobacteria bacterium]|nr:EVE domain-containing protein [Acidobacteriota bacterium]
MKWFLAKSEPDVYSIDRLEHDKQTLWDGVKNPQAVRAILSMAKGDRIFFYHSGGVSAIVGVAEVVTDGRPDPKNEKSAVADVKFVAKIDPPVTLKEIKESHLFDDWALVRQSRLSTMEAPEAFVKWVKKNRSM